MKRVYLDHIAATPLDPGAAEAMRPFLDGRFGNPQSLHGDGQEALDLTKRLQPQVVVMDISMPRMSGIDAKSALAAEDPRPAVVILSMYEARDWQKPTLEAGASAFLTKGVSAGQLLAAVRRAARA